MGKKVYEKLETEQGEIVLSSIAFTLSKSTSMELDPSNDLVTAEDLEENRNQVLSELRKKAYGIFLNFISAEEFDFASDIHRLKNGSYEETITKQAGGMPGSIYEKITVEMTVCYPDMSKVDRLLKEYSGSPDFSILTFGLSVPLKEDETITDLEKRCFKKLQDEYIILSYDTEDGMTIEMSDDLYLAINFFQDGNLMKVKLYTKFAFQFEEKIREFLILGFVKDLLKRS